jgi:hypothetical protein
MIDVLKARPLSHWARQMLMGPKGQPVSLQSVVRWVRRGVEAPSGERVYLSAARMGSRWVTDEHSIREFVQKLTPGHVALSEPRSSAARRSADESADQGLRRSGW